MSRALSSWRADRLGGIAVLGALVALWAGVTTAGWVSPVFLPSPSATWTALRTGMQDGELWLFSRRSAIFLAIPFALAGSWTSYLIGVALYAAISFFIVQHVRHQPPS